MFKLIGRRNPNSPPLVLSVCLRFRKRTKRKSTSFFIQGEEDQKTDFDKQRADINIEETELVVNKEDKQAKVEGG